MRGSFRRRALGALAVGVALAASGCGGAEQEASDGAEGPFRIGVLAPMTGPFAQLGKDQVDGMKLFLQQTPQAGGRKLELVVEDTAGDPQAAVSRTRKLIADEDVDAISGVVSSGELNAVKDQIMSRKVPLVVTNAGLDAFTAQRPASGFRVSHANAQNNRVIGWYAATELGYKRVAVLATDFTAGIEHTKAFRETFEAAGGEVVAELKPPVAAPDFAPFISRVPKDADALYIFLAGADAVKFWTQAKALGLTKRMPIIGPGFVADDFILSAVGDAADGFVGALQYVSTIDSPANAAFAKDYTALSGRPPNQFSSDGYTGMQAIASGLEASGGAGGDELVRALEGVKFDAPRGEVAFDANHQAVLTVRIYEVKGGKPVVRDEVPGVGQDWQPPAN